MRYTGLSIAATTLLTAVIVGTPTASSAQNPDAALFPPLPKVAEDLTNPVTPEKVKLGEKLYFEKRFSKSGTLSCNSCHDLARYGVDNEPTSPGHEGKRGERNSPTVYNAAVHAFQFWDGRAKSVEEQALGPILNPVEMGMASEGDVLAVLHKDAEYQKLFKAAFPSDKDPLVFENVGKAIGAFERTLMTPSRFDAYIQGDKSALTEMEVKGFERFKATGCTTCHMGTGIGGMMFQKLGLVKPYPTEDTGRHAVTGNEADKYMFKVPSLRNVAHTGPYFHDGSVKTLEEAVKIMAEYQLGKTLSDEETKEIVTFLNALTGEIPEKYRSAAAN